jgi:hypothetical protein
MSYTPVVEPATPSEIYRYFLEAAALARTHRMAVMLRLTTHVCHAKEMVSFSGWTPAPAGKQDDRPIFDGSGGAYIPIGPMVARMKKRALERLQPLPARSSTGLSITATGITESSPRVCRSFPSSTRYPEPAENRTFSNSGWSTPLTGRRSRASWKRIAR